MTNRISPRAGVVTVCGIAAGLAAAPYLRAQTPTGGQATAPTPAPVVLTLPTQPPAGAVALFTGRPEHLQNNWYKRYSTEPAPWTVGPDGVASPKQGDITSRQEFGDCYVHAEFRTPTTGGSNSGVALQGRYEIQIEGGEGRPPRRNGVASLYSQKAPRVNASKKAGEWQTYDIIFRAPRFDAANKVTEKARATVFHNGVIVQNNEEFTGMTGIQYGQYKEEAETGPIVLQGDHDPVQFRNVWVVPM